MSTRNPMRMSTTPSAEQFGRLVNSIPHTQILGWQRGFDLVDLRKICEQNTLTRHIFSYLSALMIMCHMTLAEVLVRVIPSMCHAPGCVSDVSSTLHFALFTLSPIFYFILLIFHFIFYVGQFGVKPPVRFREWGVWHFGQQRPSHSLRAHVLRRLPLLRDHWNFHPGVLQRHQTLVLAWLRDQWWHHRQSALFTSVHSGVRRTSGPKTSLSIFWRKFLSSSVLFCVSRKNGETRAWTQFAKFTQQRKTKSRLRKWANQKSSGTTKRANSRWL